MTNGVIIKQLRRERHLTQAQLAEKVGVKTATVSAWENGRIKIRPERLSALGAALNHEFESVCFDDIDKGSPFCACIKAMRLRRGLSPTEFAKEIGVSYISIMRWEKGVVPSRRTVLQQLEVHGIPLPAEHKPVQQLTVFGENLTRLRRESKLSQKTLGQTIGVDDTSISAWETGRYVPSESNLEKLCQYFGVTSAEMMSKGE